MGVFKDFLARRTQYFTSPKKKNLDEDWPGWGSFVAAALAPAFLDSPIVFLSLFSFYTEVFCRGCAGTSILGLSYFFFCCYFLFTLGDLCRGCAGTSFFFPLEHTHTHNQRQTHTIIPSLPPSPPPLHLFPPPPSLSTNTIHFDMKIWREFDMDIYRET